MKRFSFYLLISLLTFTTLKAQDFSTSHNTLLGLSVTVSDEVVNRLDRYEVETDRERDLMQRYDDTMNYRMQRLVQEPLFALMEEQGISLQPSDALRDFVNYGNDNMPSYLFPKQAIRKILNRGYETDYFFQIKISIEANSLMAGLMERVKPKITCTIKVFDAERDVVKEVQYQYVAADHIKETQFPGIRFDKLGLDYREMLLDRLDPMLMEAIVETMGEW